MPGANWPLHLLFHRVTSITDHRHQDPSIAGLQGELDINFPLGRRIEVGALDINYNYAYMVLCFPDGAASVSSISQ